MEVEIISTGDEVITGFITDTNVSWLCQELLSLGIQAHFRHSVGDNLEDITSLISERSKHCDLLLVNGGLGPTSDDNTTEAAAKACGVKQVLNEQWLERLESWHKARGRVMPKTNIKQAMLPEGAIMIDNKNGTACGFALKINRALCFFTPGVPSEFKSMYLSEIKPWIIRDFVHELHTKVKRLFLFGISESLLGQKINALNLPSSIVVGYRAAYPLLELKLIENSTSQGEESEALTQILPFIKNYLLCENTFDLPERIANLSDNAGFCLFDNLSAGALAFELSSKVNLISAYLSSEDLNDEVRNTLLSQKARYFFVALKNPQHDCFDFELYDTCEKRKWHQQYRLEVTIKDKKKAAIPLLAQDFIFKALQNLESIHPDNCEIKKISWGETYNAS